MSIDHAHTWILENGIVTLSETPAVPSIVSYILQERGVKKWWSHSKGACIHNCYMMLSSSDDIITCKLVGGKVTLVHRNYWQALLRVCTDVEWRNRRIASLNAGCREALDCLESVGVASIPEITQHLGNRKLSGVDRSILEKKMLVASGELHTRTGAHVIQLRSWYWLREKHNVDTQKLTFEEAVSTLNERGVSLS